MIVYNLACDQSHHFEGWFSSADDFDKQLEHDQVSCPVCGSVSVSKKLSAPYVSTKSDQPQNKAPKMSPETAVAGMNLQQLHNKFIDYVMKNTVDVGKQFPEEARKIHYGEVEHRSIRGQASPDTIEELRDEGIEVFSLPESTGLPDKAH